MFGLPFHYYTFSPSNILRVEVMHCRVQFTKLWHPSFQQMYHEDLVYESVGGVRRIPVTSAQFVIIAATISSRTTLALAQVKGGDHTNCNHLFFQLL